MDFQQIVTFLDAPKVIADGDEVEVIRFALLETGSQEFVLRIDAPECRRWRHYYTDKELNALSQMLRFEFRFLMSREEVYHAALGQSIALCPLYEKGSLYTVCYAYTEQSNGHYVFWLLGMVKSEIALPEHTLRVENIKRYWLKP